MNPLITSLNNAIPAIHPNAFVDISARIIGQVVVEEKVTIWPMAVVRADSAQISIRRSSAILDLALIEAPEGHPVEIGEGSLISHGAMIHGAFIGQNVLIGMGAIILEGAIVSAGSIVGAGAVVPANTKVPPNTLILGIPGKVIRQTTAQERQDVMVQLDDLYRKSRAYTGKA